MRALSRLLSISGDSGRADPAMKLVARDVDYPTCLVVGWGPGRQSQISGHLGLPISMPYI